MPPPVSVVKVATMASIGSVHDAVRAWPTCVSFVGRPQGGLLNPSAVVVGGDMAAAYDTFVAGLRETLYAESTALASRELEILPSTYGTRAGVVGCAQLALTEVLSASSVDRALKEAANQ